MELCFRMQQWEYIGEGSAHAVFKFIGDELKLQCYVLRVPISCDAKLNGREQNINKRMTDMLGASSVFVPQSYRIVISNPEEVIRAYSTVSERHSLLQADRVRSWSYLVEDAMYIPHRQSSVVTFEIKPKWGSLPLHPIEAVEQTKCRFCIQQYKKLRSGKATSLSLYCPLRLFSTATNQMQSFLDLMKTPQNNFGVFVDGSRQHLDAVCIPINEAALDNLLSDLGLLPCPPYSSEMAVAILLTTAVQQRNVLNDLLSVQNASDWNEKMALDYYNNYLNDGIGGKELEAFLISRGARDCSVMISMHFTSTVEEVYPSSCFVVPYGEQFVVFRISLVDYEVKQIQKIPIWYEEYVDILETYKLAVCAK